MVAFKIRVQRTTWLPDGDLTQLRIPFSARMWEMYEVDPKTGRSEYFGFALSHGSAVKVVSDVLKARHRRANSSWPPPGIVWLAKQYGVELARWPRPRTRPIEETETVIQPEPGSLTERLPAHVVRELFGDDTPQEAPC
ncbi:hypothetical protein [Brevibacterium casei]|uniref:hypothetical protein n=1 Tax=Brevibacterium casei TaxID=33889 RepID=UPI00241D8D9B|nr:hypothetical protein [Brevibacterium casei]